MASFEVEIATTSSPFGAVHNHRDSCFQNNLNNLVSACIPDDNKSPPPPPPPDIDFTDLWVHRPQWQTTTTNNNNHCCDSSSNTPEKNNDDHRSSSIEAAPAHHHHRLKDKCRRAVFSTAAHDQGRSTESSSSDSTFVEVPNLGGVSSLVQKWRGFEAVAKCCSSSSSSSTTTTTKNNTSNACQDFPGTNEDDPFFGDWESDRTAVSGPPSSRGRESDVTESERLRVADIIKKLTEDRSSDAGGPDSSPRGRISLDQSEQRPCFSALQVGSPRVRGRQAYNDLLMQMECERHKELEGLVGRRFVSKFSHRGRIQALLRIRFLHRAGMEAKEGRHSNSTSSGSHKTMQSVIAHFREKVKSSAKNGTIQSASFCKKPTEDTSAAPNLPAANQEGYEIQYQEVTSSKSSPGARASHILDDEHDVDCNSHNVTENLEHQIRLFHNHLAETSRTFHHSEINSAETTEIPLSSIEMMDDKERGVTNKQIVERNFDLSTDCAHPLSYQEGESNSYQNTVETATYWVSDVSHPEVGWEKMYSDYEQQSGSKRDWMDEVSRPRGDWEDLRKARYQEMLDPFLDNEEIRVLLGRRSVSTFLSSGLREKIDQVMMLHAQGRETLKNEQSQEEKHAKLPEQEQSQAVAKKDGEGNDMMDQQEEEDYGDYLDEYIVSEGSVGQQYTESDDYTDHLISSPPASWGHNQGPESSDYSYQIASPAQKSSTNFYSQNNGSNSSYRVHPVIDVELVHDLRRHMEQLHQEMSELRKSIKCCMDMQIKLQSSIRKEVAVALKHSDTKNGSIKKVRGGGRCRVCCKMQVDSLLYRCGHMCTCYECAYKLQLSSWKCPICDAPVIDVVRIHAKYA